MKNWFLIMILPLVLVGCGTPSTPPPEIEIAEPSPTSKSVTENYIPAPTPTQSIQKANYPDLGEAPELSNDVWLNTNGEALRLANLRGKVVIIDMWTYG